MPPRPSFTAKLISEEMLSEPTQTKHLVFETQDEALDHFNYAAGQFISMTAPDPRPERAGKIITRAYSIASASNGRFFDLCLNRVEGGFFSNYLCDMRLGDTVGFHGPHGNFVLRNPLRDCVFIATGTGIAPMRAFVQWLFADETRVGEMRLCQRKIHLVYGTRYPTDIYYQQLFEETAQHFPEIFDYRFSLSRPHEGWTGLRGYVQEHVREIVAARPDETRNHMDAYICGLNDMVSANRQLLVEQFGWDKKQVIFERYD
ncbi:MAG: FAD-dependent oxidoreductase [Acidobacteriaceae bacterium]